MSEDVIQDLLLSFRYHDEMISQRQGQVIDELGELDGRIVALEEYILSILNRYLELYDQFSFDNFLLEV